MGSRPIPLDIGLVLLVATLFIRAYVNIEQLDGWLPIDSIIINSTCSYTVQTIS